MGKWGVAGLVRLLAHDLLNQPLSARFFIILPRKGPKTARCGVCQYGRLNIIDENINVGLFEIQVVCAKIKVI